MASIRDVAAAADVSLGTVSKVLNNRTDANVSTATRQRIFEAARRVGYHPSAIARGLAGKRMNAMGVVMAYSEPTVTADHYLGPCLDGILQVCKQARQKAVIFLEGSWEDTVAQVPVYCDGHCDGLLLVIPRLDSAIVPELAARNVPFVLVGDSRSSEQLTRVDVDNEAAARLAVQHLLILGHQRIAAFLGNRDFCSNGQRLTGYQTALAEAGIPWKQEWLFTGEYQAEFGRRNVAQFLERFPDPTDRPTALFCFNDDLALSALQAFAAQGIRVPDEISVVGLDDVPAAATSDPPLTTVRQSVRSVGEEAARLLLKRIAGTTSIDTCILLPPELVVRGSTALPLNHRR